MSNTNTDDVIRKTVSMYADDWRIVERVSEQLRLQNTSAALRFIVNEYQHEYQQLRGQPPLPLIEEE